MSKRKEPKTPVVAEEPKPKKSKLFKSNDENSDPVNSAGTASKGGELIFAGTLDFHGAKSSSHKEGKNIWEFSRLSIFKGVPVTLVASSSSAVHSVIVTTSGSTYAWGRGGKGQLGIGSCPTEVVVPIEVPGLKGKTVIGAATGSAHTLVLTLDGDVFGFGANNSGQLGIGNLEPVISEPTRMLSIKIFSKVACGAEFSMIIDSKGRLFSCGNSINGQLGHGQPKEIIETANRNSFECENRARKIKRFILKDPKTKFLKDLENVKITDVQCGGNHTLAIDSTGRLYTWGFGGYGRLGHGSPSDEVYPRLVNTFNGPRRMGKRIWAGGSYSMAVSEVDCPYFWGQLSTTGGGEASMYPKSIDHFKQNDIRGIGTAFNSIIVLADEDLITWGKGSTGGQLGLGEEQKSSAQPVKVPGLDGIHFESVVCGYASTMLIAKSDSIEDIKMLNTLPIVNL